MSTDKNSFQEMLRPLETARLSLRWPQAGDGAEFNAAVVESLPQLQPWFDWAMETPTVEDSEAYMQYVAGRVAAREELTWLLFLKEKPTLIGVVSFHNIDWSVPKLMISFWVRSSYARQGYMTEAMQKLVDLAFETLGVYRVEIWCDSRNDRSIALAQRLGFEHEGTLRCDYRDHLTNELADQMVFARIRPELQR